MNGSATTTGCFSTLAADVAIPPGTRLLIEPAIGGKANQYRLLTLSGLLVADFRVASERMTALMATPEFVTAEVTQPEDPDPSVAAYIRIESI